MHPDSDIYDELVNGMFFDAPETVPRGLLARNRAENEKDGDVAIREFPDVLLSMMNMTRALGDAVAVLNEDFFRSGRRPRGLWGLVGLLGLEKGFLTAVQLT
jgi:hypothetical protein